MPSPFPGMNPYFEDPARWRDFHSTFLVYLRAALTPLVVPRYEVDLEVSLYLERPGEEEGRLFAVGDAAVVPAVSSDEVGEHAATVGGTAVAAAVAPVIGTVSIPDQKPARWLTVRNAQDRQVVTVIELLSPANKQPGKDRDRYVDKRFELMSAYTNLVEIDLLRGGRRMPVQGAPASTYSVVVSRWTERPRVGVWPFGLRDPMPVIPIPLRPGETEPVVPLKLVLDRVYDDGGYAYRLKYTEPNPPLSPADAAWAKEIVDRAAPPA